MNTITIDSISDINKIIDVIHDEQFDLNEIKLVDSILSIRFQKMLNESAEIIKDYLLWKKVKAPVKEFLLNIYFVDGYEIEDTEKIGSYDFNTIVYYENKKLIKILTGIPLKFNIRVSDFKISVEESEETLYWKNKIVIY